MRISGKFKLHIFFTYQVHYAHFGFLSMCTITICHRTFVNPSPNSYTRILTVRTGSQSGRPAL